MAGISERRRNDEVQAFSSRWQRLAELMSKAVVEPKLLQETEKEYLLLTGELAHRAVTLAPALNLEKSFVQQVSDFLEDVFNLRILSAMQEFQITLLRERWNSILITINSASTRRK